jgi:hypothetical protein
MIGSRRVHLPVAIVSIGREGQSKEERYEKEVQEEIEGNVNNWNARRVRLSVCLPREKHKKKSGPLTRGRFVYCTQVGI